MLALPLFSLSIVLTNALFGTSPGRSTYFGTASKHHGKPSTRKIGNDNFASITNIRLESLANRHGHAHHHLLLRCEPDGLGFELEVRIYLSSLHVALPA